MTFFPAPALFPASHNFHSNKLKFTSGAAVMAKPLITVLLLLIVNGVDDKVSVFVTVKYSWHHLIIKTLSIFQESGILDVERFSTAIVFCEFLYKLYH